MTAVVMLPGLAGHHSEFAAQVGHLQPTRRVLALDPFVDGVCPWPGQMNRIVEIAQREGLGRFVIVGTDSRRQTLASGTGGRPVERHPRPIS